MAERKMWIDRSTLEEIADAIRTKKGTTDLIPVTELKDEILSIEGGETVEVIPDGYIKPSGEINITENKTVDVTQYASAKINVPIPSGYIKPSGAKPITTNGTHDVTNYASVEINVPTEAAEEIPDHTDSDFALHLTNAGSGELGVVYSSTEKVSFEAEPNGKVIETFHDVNFVPKHIEKGVTIFGVTGEYEGEGSTDSALPIEVATEIEMNALLSSGEVGGVYKYVGEASSTYEYGALYVLEVDI